MVQCRNLLRLRSIVRRFVVILLACLVGREAYAAPKSVKLSSDQIEAATKQIAEAAEAVLPFVPDRIWKAHQLLQRVFSLAGVEASEPKLAAKAHRVMAGVYFAANTIAGPTGNQVEADVKELGRDGWNKAAQELEKSLRLDPKQVDARKLKDAVPLLRKGGIPLTQFDELLGLLTMSVKDKARKP